MKIGLRTVKTAIAAGLSIIVATKLGLLYAPSAGIIAVLSVGNTKKTSLFTGISRLLALTLATAIAFICFRLFGFNPVAFSLFLFLFIPVTVRLSLIEGIVVSSVLMTHYLTEKSFALSLIMNEYLLMIIGISFALLFNLYMPDMEKRLKDDQKEIESTFQVLIHQMGEYLNHPGQAQITAACQKLIQYIRQSQERAVVHQENQWLSESGYYEDYFAMRRSQVRLLQDMIQLLETIWVEEAFVEELRALLFYTADHFSEANDGQEILRKIAHLYVSYREKPLPKTREEFENRARLFQFFQIFKSFIEIKAEFSENKQTSEKRP